ncbi:MAG: SEC-C metal-binding domain-containing protein [Bacteriovoracaceae bacterium]|nr:SEC-C metal-binding domain-containing protein [Bacteriovoracaceae bacterium]
MLNPATDTYLGDDNLECLLKEVGTKLSLYEVKALVLGAIINVEFVPPSQILESISQNPVDETLDEISFADKDQATRFYGQFLLCWNSLIDTEQTPNIFSPLPKDLKGDEIARVVEARCDELTCFLTLVDADEQIEDFTDEAALEALFDLQDLEVSLYEFLDYLPEDFEKRKEEILGVLDELQRSWEYGFPLIKKQLAVLRLQNNQKALLQSSPSKFELSRPSKNSSCDCGSGKKFKRCCGIES